MSSIFSKKLQGKPNLNIPLKRSGSLVPISSINLAGLKHDNLGLILFKVNQYGID